MHYIFAMVCFIIIINTHYNNAYHQNPEHEKEFIPIKYTSVKAWADKFGVELWHLGDFITRRKEVQDSFKSSLIHAKTGSILAATIAREIESMMNSKINAVKRIMDAAENSALSHQRDVPNKRHEYYSAKEMLEPHEPTPTIMVDDMDDVGLERIRVNYSRIILTPNPRFFNIAVNTTLSSVHIPTNLYDRADDVIKGIQWSENLDSIFLDNYEKDPSLSWQYFGSSLGFMRQFPAAKWKQEPVDLYDCRLRTWYIEAATSPKDIVILVDVSGSMKGQGADIAKHVVFNILETIGMNDFVNIYKFSDTVEAVVKCFNESLVPATLANIQELRLGMENITMSQIANYTAALIKAFEILENYRTNDLGAKCNQAIMLISDGVPYYFTEVFEQYNWFNSTFMPVRIFTYLIGKEVAEVKQIKDIACQNKGYYVHLTTLSEVREQVLNYIAVMARPLVLEKHDHPVIWTHVYADVVDPLMTDFLWDAKECAEQKELFETHRKNKGIQEQEIFFEIKQRKNLEPMFGTGIYDLMITISMPVYDRRENATKLANLLGVAGTDIPVMEIKKLMKPSCLGVNGYAFIVTNNGYILTHPDHRPLFQGILKPSYSSIDMLEVELLDDDNDPREFSPILLEVRERIIKQTNGSKWLAVKYHLDQMKRASQIKRDYFWSPIENTPYTLVMTYPEQYGSFYAEYDEEVHRIFVKGNNLLSFFSGQNWKIHPDWIYCKSIVENFSSPEAELKYFLDMIQRPGWKWKDRPHSPQEHIHTSSQSNFSGGRGFVYPGKDSYYCDRTLLQNVVYDAKVTEWFERNNTFNNSKDGKRPIAVLIGLLPSNELKQRFGINVAFLSTHSGLTRWIHFPSNSFDREKEQEFSDNNKNSIDEIWYKRAVEYHFIEPQSFVFSVPFNTRSSKDILVTASHAVFRIDDKKIAPVAVVGFQFQHSALYALFKNITSNCINCAKTCFSDDLECFILDNNGYVIVSNIPDDIGKFFGEIRGSIMSRLISEKVYKEIRIYDYQGICFKSTSDKNLAAIIQTPLQSLLKIFAVVSRTIMWLLMKIITEPVEAYGSYEDLNYDLPTLEPLDIKEISKEKEKAFDSAIIINRTRLQPCDRVVSLYTLYSSNRNRSVFQTPSHGCERPFTVLPIPQTNLILLVIETMCPVDNINYRFTTTSYQYDYKNESLPCIRNTINLKRKRPISCINSHVNESHIEMCGKASKYTLSALVYYIIIIDFIIFS